LKARSEPEIAHGTFTCSLYDIPMISWKAIKSYVAALAGQFAPERVILFGSYARGMLTLAKKYGLSDVGMSKLCRRNNIPVSD